MLHRFSGKLVHVDFGDCFEVAQHRDKFPERIPFRLTRMLTNAMEVSGIEGTFRDTCQRVMTVLRSNKGSVIAMLEAFVHDPLINWRLLLRDADAKPATGAASMTMGGASNNKHDTDQAPISVIRQNMQMSTGDLSQGGLSSSDGSSDDEDGGSSCEAPPIVARSVAESVHQRRSSLRQAHAEAAPNHQALNQKAVEVMKRVQNKLHGRDFIEDKVLQVDEQVIFWGGGVPALMLSQEM
jgi:FKBP12-rapamycin complex-associated protein